MNAVRGSESLSVSCKPVIDGTQTHNVIEQEWILGISCFSHTFLICALGLSITWLYDFDWNCTKYMRYRNRRRRVIEFSIQELLFSKKTGMYLFKYTIFPAQITMLSYIIQLTGLLLWYNYSDIPVCDMILIIPPTLVCLRVLLRSAIFLIIQPLHDIISYWLHFLIYPLQSWAELNWSLDLSVVVGSQNFLQSYCSFSGFYLLFSRRESDRP